jgi:hypothetical protein
MSRTISTSRRRWYYQAWFSRLNSFVDNGLRTLTRSELVVYLILLRDTRPDGTARAGLTDLATRAGVSKRSAIRAIQALIDCDVLHVVRRGVPGKPTLYTIFPTEVFKRLNPTAATWMEPESGAAEGTDAGDTRDTKKGDTDGEE